MSSEPIASAPQASEASQGEFIADAELVLAALNRMETAVHADRLALARLRPALAELAVALGNAKRAVTLGAGRPLDVAMLLDELEHRVNATIEIAGAEPVPALSGSPPAPPIEEAAPHAEHGSAGARVPTVSDVVSRLDRSDDPRGDTAKVTSSVSDLEAMVQALSAPTLDVGAAPNPAAFMPPPEAQAPPALEAVAPTEPSPPAPDAVETENAWLAKVAELQAAPADPAPSEAAAQRDLDIDDLAELLFEPTPELPVDIEPQTGPPQPSPTSGAAAAATVRSTATQAPEPNENVSEKRRGVAHGPLAPLQAMSPEERLALFS
jgi:hypothetical protein